MNQLLFVHIFVLIVLYNPDRLCYDVLRIFLHSPILHSGSFLQSTGLIFFLAQGEPCNRTAFRVVCSFAIPDREGGNPLKKPALLILSLIILCTACAAQAA